MKELDTAAPGRCIWFNSADLTKPEAAAQLTRAVKDGARGFGELKFHVAYPNLFADCAANSGNNALSRDPAFTPDFLKRHQDKLLFGSDCSCADGRGGGVSQSNNPAASRLAGKCVARETLTVLKKSASPDIFRKIVWENTHRLLQLSPTPH